MKLEIARHEVPFIINGLSQLKGLKDWKKAIALGDDLRRLRKLQKESEEAVKFCKPETYDELATEFQSLCRAKASELGQHAGVLLNESDIGSHVMLIWDKAEQWHLVNKQYQEAVYNLNVQMVQIELQTEKLMEKDFDQKLIDSNLAEVLSYFQ